MDGQENSGGNGMSKMIFPTVIIALIVIAAIGFYATQNKNTAVDNDAIQSTESVSSSPEASAAVKQGSYKDGTYSVVGNYVSPGGPRTLEVTITLADGVITGAETIGTATDATSKRFQGEFVGGFKTQVVGKNIDEVNLVKVAGSSLSPKGFNDAISKVKAEAAS